MHNARMTRPRNLVLVSLTLGACLGAAAQEDVGATAQEAGRATPQEAGRPSGRKDRLEDRLDLEPQRCVSLPLRPRVDVIDDRTIIFHVRGRTYVNHLRLRCPGLAASSNFVSDSRHMCESDWITIVEGFGFTRRAGARCPVGEFLPIDPETAELLVLAAEGDGYVVPYEYEVVELPPAPTPRADDGAQSSGSGVAGSTDRPSDSRDAAAQPRR